MAEDGEAVQIGDWFVAAVEASVTYARSFERVRAAMTAVGGVIGPFKEIVEGDPELGPEVTAAAEALDQAHAALQRAATFLTARYDQKMDSMHAEMGRSS